MRTDTIETEALVTALKNEITLMELSEVARVLTGEPLEMAVTTPARGANQIVEYVSFLKTLNEGEKIVHDFLQTIVDLYPDKKQLGDLAKSIGIIPQATHASEQSASTSPDALVSPGEAITEYSSLEAGKHLSRFIGRKAFWKELCNTLGVYGPEQKIFEIRGKGKTHSAAILVHYEDPDDSVHELGKALSDYLVSEGQLSPSGQADSLKLKTLNWPESGQITEIFRIICNEYPDGQPHDRWFDSEATIRESFVSFISHCYEMNPNQSGVILTTVDLLNDRDNKLTQIDQLVVFWNSLHWQFLNKRMVLLIFIRYAKQRGLFKRLLGSFSSVKSATSSPIHIGQLNPECIENWRLKFLTNRMQIPDLQPVPDWWPGVDQFKLDKPGRFKTIQQALFN